MLILLCILGVVYPSTLLPCASSILGLSRPRGRRQRDRRRATGHACVGPKQNAALPSWCRAQLPWQPRCLSPYKAKTWPWYVQRVAESWCRTGCQLRGAGGLTATLCHLGVI